MWAAVLPYKTVTTVGQERTNDFNVVSCFTLVNQSVEKNNVYSDSCSSLWYLRRIVLNGNGLDSAEVTKSVLSNQICLPGEPGCAFRSIKSETRISKLCCMVCLRLRTISDKGANSGHWCSGAGDDTCYVPELAQC